MSTKPIAKILVLAGPTHYGVRLPVAGLTDFVPGTTVRLYHPDDLKAAERVLPAAQCKVRTFPRIEDIPAIEPQPEEPVKPAKKKGAKAEE